jgi:streptomycin 6-kinase
MDDTAFVRRITATFAPDGAAWLERLPATIAHYAALWRLTVGPAFAGLSYNYVAPATRVDGAPAVLKLGVPRAELTTEIAALELYGGADACRLPASDAAGAALLLERLTPGIDLTTIADEAMAMRIAAQVMRQIHHAPPARHRFPHVAGWLAGLARLRPYFGGGTGPFPEALVARAEALSAALLASSAPEVVLHGDLHHFNMLQSERGWLAIDPKGVIGEPAYEAGALLRNPLPHILTLPNRRAVLARRSALLAAALELDVTRIRQWAAVQAVLSAWWDVEDGAPEAVQPAIALAADLMSLI